MSFGSAISKCTAIGFAPTFVIVLVGSVLMPFEELVRLKAFVLGFLELNCSGLKFLLC